MFLSCNSFSQTGAVPSAVGYLNINNVSAPFSNGGDMFWDWNMPGLGYVVPKTQPVRPILAGSLWIGGYVQGNLLRMAAMTYRQNGIDFWAGPLDTASANNTSNTNNYNKVWSIRSYTVDSFNQGLLMPSPTSDFATWPANGDQSAGEAKKLAPYFDANGDNNYNYLNGDYPIIRGGQALYSIYNDRGAHGETGALPLGIEVHSMPYAFNCTDSAFWNTVFIHYDIINRSANNIDSVFVTQWNDYELGNYGDDFIACDTTLEMGYLFNGNNNDPGGYLNKLPAFGTVLLNKSISSFSSYNNSGSLFNGNPSQTNNGMEYYNYMRGKWRNGSSIMYGGNGITGTQPTTFLFSGDPVAGTGWNMLGNLPPGDVRGLISFGPENLTAGATISFDVAYVFARDYVNLGNNLNPITLLKQRVQTIRNAFQAQANPCTNSWIYASGISTPSTQKFSVYPNPSLSELFIDGLLETTEYKIIDCSGNIMNEGNLNSSNAHITIAQLPQGLYFLLMNNNSGSKSIKFVKENN